MLSWTSYIPIIIIVLLLVAFFVWSFISQRKKQKAFNDTVNAVRPGSKVKTIGGIVGEVVEVDDAEGTFVLKTGDSEGNYSYMKFDKPSPNPRLKRRRRKKRPPKLPQNLPKLPPSLLKRRKRKMRPPRIRRTRAKTSNRLQNGINGQTSA